MYKTVRGLVLREVKYKESSKMLTILTEEEGKLSAEARGALRKSSRIMAASQQGTYSELTLFENRGRHTVTEGAVIEDFAALRERFEDFALAAYFLELLETVSDEDSPDSAILHLGLNTLFALSRRLYPSKHIKAVFELRLMCLAGFAPEAEACAVCGREDPENPKLMIDGGFVRCAACTPAESGRSTALCAASLAAMRHVIHSAPKKVFSFTLDDPSSAKFCRAAEEYLLAQLDRSFASLDYWKSVNKLT